MVFCRRRRGPRVFISLVALVTLFYIYWQYNQRQYEYIHTDRPAKERSEGESSEETHDYQQSDSETSLTQDASSKSQSKVLTKPAAAGPRNAPLDADHVSTMASEFQFPKDEPNLSLPREMEPPELESVVVAKVGDKFQKLLGKLPSTIDKYCQLPYSVPRGHDGMHNAAYKLIASYQLIAPGPTAPSSSHSDKHVQKFVDAALSSFDCTLDSRDTERIRMDFGDFSNFLKSWRKESQFSDFVNAALRDDNACDPGQITPLGIAYHLELGESLAVDLMERDRLFNAGFEDDYSDETDTGTIADDTPNTVDAEKWLSEVREATRDAFRKRVRARATRSQPTAIAALATMFGLAKRLHIPTKWIDVELVDETDRFCKDLSDEKKDSMYHQSLDCDCAMRSEYASELAHKLNVAVRFARPDQFAKETNRYRDLLQKLNVTASQFDSAARVLLASACDQLEIGCYNLKKGHKDEDEVCIDTDDLTLAVMASEMLENEYAHEHYTHTYSVLSAYPYLLDLVKRWTRDIAGPETNYKLLDTHVRLRQPKAASSHKPREFVALNLDFADVHFLIDLRRTLNVSSIGTSTRWMGYGQRVIFELYESLLRAAGEVLVRIADPDRELTQKSVLMCPKTYGGGMCQLSLIDEYVKSHLVFDSTGVFDFNKLCRP